MYAYGHPIHLNYDFVHFFRKTRVRFWPCSAKHPVSCPLTDAPLSRCSGYRVLNQSAPTGRHGEGRTGRSQSVSPRAHFPSDHGSDITNALATPMPPAPDKKLHGNEAQESEATLRSTPRRRLQLRQSNFQAGSRCGGRRVRAADSAGAHERNEKPAPVQSPKRRAARQAAKELLNTFPCQPGQSIQL